MFVNYLPFGRQFAKPSRPCRQLSLNSNYLGFCRDDRLSVVSMAQPSGLFRAEQGARLTGCVVSPYHSQGQCFKLGAAPTSVLVLGEAVKLQAEAEP